MHTAYTLQMRQQINNILDEYQIYLIYDYYCGHNVLEEAICYGLFDSLSCKQIVWKYNNLKDSWTPLCNKDNRCVIYMKYWTIAFII